MSFLVPEKSADFSPAIRGWTKMNRAPPHQLMTELFGAATAAFPPGISGDLLRLLLPYFLYFFAAKGGRIKKEEICREMGARLK